MGDCAEATGGAGVGAESKRGRVRRFFVDPMLALGFRKAGGVTAEKHAAALAGLCDNLAYMPDDRLGALLEMVRTKGAGPNRDIWPSAAVVLNFAELIVPRPLEELPSLLRWFRSVEGPRALHDQTLVETFVYFRRYKRPPVMAQLQITQEAADNRRKLELLADREARGVASADDVQWLAWYRGRLAYCTAIVTGADVAKGAGA